MASPVFIGSYPGNADDGIVGTGWGRVDGIADSQVGRIEAPPLLKFYMSLRLMGGRRLMRTAPGFNLEF